MRESRKIAMDVSWGFISSIINMGFALLVSIALGRLLGPTSLGLFQMTVTTFFLTIIFVGMGIPAAVTKFIAECRNFEDEQNQIMSSSLFLAILFGLFAGIIMFILSEHLARFFDMPDLTPLLQLVSIAFQLRLFILIHQAYLNGLRLMRNFAISVILESVLTFLFVITLIFLGYGVFGAVFGLIGAMLANTIFLILMLKSWRFFTLKNLRKTCTKLLSFGIVILAGSAINEINYRTDTLLLGYFADEEQVGLYSAGITLSRFFLMIPNAVQRVTYPATSEYWKDQRYQELSLLLQRSIKYTTSFIFFAGICGLIFAKEIIFLLYGESFEPTILAFQLLVVGVAANSAFSRSIGGTLTAIYRQKLSVVIVLFTTSVNIVLAILLIPEMGIIGAAIATLTSFTLRGILGLFFSFYYTNTRIDYFWFIRAILLSGLALITYFIASMWVNSLISGAFVILAFMIIILTIFLAPDDRRFFLDLMKESIQRIKA